MKTLEGSQSHRGTTRAKDCAVRATYCGYLLTGSPLYQVMKECVYFNEKPLNLLAYREAKNRDHLLMGEGGVKAHRLPFHVWPLDAYTYFQGFTSLIQSFKLKS